jgi:hypothetical protein
MAVKYFKRQHNTPTFSIPRPSKLYQKFDFCYAYITSGNPAGTGSTKLRGLPDFTWCNIPKGAKNISNDNKMYTKIYQMATI